MNSPVKVKVMNLTLLMKMNTIFIVSGYSIHQSRIAVIIVDTFIYKFDMTNVTAAR